MYVVATGNVFDGITLHGPFNSADEAIEYAEDNNFDEWCVKGLLDFRSEE